MIDLGQLITDAESNRHDVWIAGPAGVDAIQILENAMKRPLPKSLTRFLADFGAVGIGDSFLSGIVSDDPLEIEAGNIYADTMILREECTELPDGFWVIQRHEDGAFCLDVNRNTDGDEYAVVNFESGSNQHEILLTRDYNDFVNRWFFEPWGRSTE